MMKSENELELIGKLKSIDTSLYSDFQDIEKF